MADAALACPARPPWAQPLTASLPCPLTPHTAPQEFLAATMSTHQIEKAENMRAAFAHFDTDGSGTISKEELRQALQVRGPGGRGQGGTSRG